MTATGDLKIGPEGRSCSFSYPSLHACHPSLHAQDNYQVRMDREKELLAKVAAKKAAKDAAKR